MLGCKACSFPIEQNLKLDQWENEALVNVSQYRRLIGRLLYLQATHHDVTFVVNLLIQFVSDPLQSHMQGVTRVLRYLKRTACQWILLPRTAEPILTIFSNSDWLVCSYTRRSRTGYLLLLSGAPISLKTKKQFVASCSFDEAEYRVMASTVSEVLWLDGSLRICKLS